MHDMRAVAVNPSAPGRLALQAVAMPQPAMHEALVRVAALSLTPYEVKAVASAEPGTRPGWEFAGTVARAATLPQSDGRKPAATWRESRRFSGKGVSSHVVRCADCPR